MKFSLIFSVNSSQNQNIFSFFTHKIKDPPTRNESFLLHAKKNTTTKSQNSQKHCTKICPTKPAKVPKLTNFWFWVGFRAFPQKLTTTKPKKKTQPKRCVEFTKNRCVDLKDKDSRQQRGKFRPAKKEPRRIRMETFEEFQEILLVVCDLYSRSQRFNLN